MATRFAALTVLSSALSSAAFSVAVAVPAFAEPPAGVAPEAQNVPAVENSRFQFAGKINAPAVQVRSGPGENYYATTKLDKGVAVTVVGIKFEWLKIVPPQGSFSVVAKAFIQKSDDGRTGAVTVDALNVRAGSTLTPLKVTVQCKLDKGAIVQIVGEQDEYYKIVPPAEAYLYVHQKFVEPVRQIAPGEGPLVKSSATIEPPTAAAPTTRLIETATPVKTEELPPANQKLAAGPSVQTQFDRLEADFARLDGVRLEDQPTSELLSGYEKVLASDHLPASMRRVAEVRAAVLRIRNRSRTELLATLKQREAAQARLKGFQAERAAVETRLLGNIVYTGVGTLQASSLQIGDSGTLYRLTDPANGRTVCYIRSSDPKAITFTDRFVGVRGELSSDPDLSLRVISAKDIAPVDPNEVNKTISAYVLPPSILGRPQQASDTKAPAATESKEATGATSSAN